MPDGRKNKTLAQVFSADLSPRESMVRLNSIKNELSAMDLGFDPAIEMAIGIAVSALANAVHRGNNLKSIREV